MAANQIGSGAVVLTTSADPLVNGLRQAEDKVKAWKTRTEAAANQPSKAAEKAVKGFGAGNLIELGTIGAAAQGITAIGKAFESWHLDRINEQMERSKELVNELSAASRKLADQRVDRFVAGGPSFGSAEEIRKQLDSAQKSLQAMQAKAAADKAALDAHKSDTMNIIAKGLFEGTPLSRLPGVADSLGLKEKELEKSIAETNARLKDQKYLIEQLQLASKKVDPAAFATTITGAGFAKPLADAKKNAAAADTLTESLRNQALTWGMTGTQAQIASLRAKGATDEMLREAEAWAAHISTLEAMAKDTGPKLAGAIEAGTQQSFAATLNARGFDLGGENQVHKDNGKTLERIETLNAEFIKKLEELKEVWGDPL